MNVMKPYWVLWIPLVLAGPCAGETCGVASLLALGDLLGSELSDEQRDALVESHPAEASSLLDIKRAAEAVELALVGVAASPTRHPQATVTAAGFRCRRMG